MMDESSVIMGGDQASCELGEDDVRQLGRLRIISAR